MATYPSDLRYAKSHEWIKLDGDIATVGITDHAQAELGDVVYVDLPEVGRALQVEESFGSIESVKTVSDVYSPLAGVVVEVNAVLASQSELVNSDPYGKGYLLKLRVDDVAALANLLDADAYQAIIE
jgi:glycine cleavage system H protein